MRMARPADPSFIGGAGVITPLRKRARVRTWPVAGLFQAAPVTYIDRFFEFLVPDFHRAPYKSPFAFSTARFAFAMMPCSCSFLRRHSLS